MLTPVIISKVHETVLWRPCGSSQFLLQDASWMSMCLVVIMEQSGRHHTTINLCAFMSNQPTQESWCEGDRSNQGLHLNAIFSCLVETTTFRAAHKTPKDIWSLYEAIEAMCFRIRTYKCSGQVGDIRQKICSWDSISNWSHWEPSIAFAGRCGMWVTAKMELKMALRRMETFFVPANLKKPKQHRSLLHKLELF